MDLLARMDTFVRIVEVGSFSAAAKQLRLSVAAASRHVAALEDELGTALLVRTTRKLTITPAGRLYYERCARVLREVEDAQTVGRLGVAGPLRMSVPVSLGMLAGDTLVYSLLTRHPELRIDLRVEDQLIDLAFDNVDIAVRIGAQPPNSSEVVAVPLASWTRVIVASPAYIARRGAPKQPEDLAHHDVLSTSGGAMTDAWSLVERKRVVSARFAPRFSTNAGQLLHAAALEGHGVVLLPDWFVADDLKARRLVRVLGAYFTHREHRNRRIVNTETADGERVSDVTVIGWTYFSLGSSGLRREGPFSTSLWAVWMRRSQIASAWVDSLM